MLYWKVDCPEHFSFKNFPILIYENGLDQFYVFPEYEYPGLIKVREPYHLTKLDSVFRITRCVCTCVEDLREVGRV